VNHPPIRSCSLGLTSPRFIAGQQSNEVPDHGLCLIQATLIYATPVLCVFATLALVIQVPYSLCFSLHGDFTTRQIWQHSSTLCGVECYKLSPTFVYLSSILPLSCLPLVSKLLVMPYALALLVVAEVILVGSVLKLSFWFCVDELFRWVSRCPGMCRRSLGYTAVSLMGSRGSLSFCLHSSIGLMRDIRGTVSSVLAMLAIIASFIIAGNVYSCYLNPVSGLKISQIE